jgi:hypothetical protein
MALAAHPDIFAAVRGFVAHCRWRLSRTGLPRGLGRLAEGVGSPIDGSIHQRDRDRGPHALTAMS